MAKRILILDDDEDFNSLLTDIFKQADYAVHSEEDPEDALELFRKEPFDLVVTDQKMPNITGAEFMAEIKEIKADVPVIMVSGYLDNETIRDLIKEGVGGVFLKPLNVFSLLKRTAELIEETQAESDGAPGEGHVPKKSEFSHSLPFRFRSYPCKSDVSASFAKKVFSLRNFKSNLLLIGEAGVDFWGICQDLAEFTPEDKGSFAFLHKADFSAEKVAHLVDSAHEADAPRATVVLLDAQELNEGQKQLVYQIARKEPPFNAAAVPIRFIFCLNDDLDTLYERGVIDENLYILMGTSEARAPSLREIPEDIPVLAQQMVVDIASERGLPQVPRIDRDAREFLKNQPWPGNHRSLRKAVSDALDRSQDEILTLDAFSSGGPVKSNGGTLTNERFEESLRQFRDTYVRSFIIFCDGDRERAGKLLALPRTIVDRIAQAAE
ncbi:MAG: sigma-54-dependent transcriptional regulator [Opitutales bacterium]